MNNYYHFRHFRPSETQSEQNASQKVIPIHPIVANFLKIWGHLLTDHGLGQVLLKYLAPAFFYRHLVLFATILDVPTPIEKVCRPKFLRLVLRQLFLSDFSNTLIGERKFSLLNPDLGMLQKLAVLCHDSKPTWTDTVDTKQSKMPYFRFWER